MRGKPETEFSKLRSNPGGPDGESTSTLSQVASTVMNDLWWSLTVIQKSLESGHPGLVWPGEHRTTQDDGTHEQEGQGPPQGREQRG
jgi:hypothetical protein